MARVERPVLLPLARDLPEPRRRAVAGLGAAVAAMCALYAVLALGIGTGADGVTTWLYTGLFAAAGALCLARAALVRQETAAWVLIGLGLVVSAAGSLYYSVGVPDRSNPPFPSWADLAWLAMYPLLYAGLLVLLRRHVRDVPGSVWLDGAIGMMSVGALVAGIFLAPILDAASGSTAAVLTNLAYPAADAVLLLLVVGGLTLMGWRPGRAWALIGIGMALTAAADTIYLYRVATETFVSGTGYDLLWPAGVVALALAAWQPPREADARDEGGAMLVVPALLAGAALAVLVYDHFERVPLGALGLATGALVFLGFRVAFTVSQVRALADSRRLAVTDELTGLGNRRALYGALAGADDAPRALLLADLDHFKELNDTLGHQAGDALLRRLGARLREGALPGSVVVRLGGDEFAALLPPGTDAEAALRAAERMREVLERPLETDALTVRVEASVGIAVSAAGADVLLREADVAMYEAKRGRTGIACYDAERDDHSRERLALFGELREAIDAGQLVLHYQPQRDLRTGRTVAAEALVRWQHPVRGLLGPHEFIPLAEQTDVMRPLTLHVLERALAQAAAWWRDGLELRVAVNVAVANLLDHSFPGEVARLVQAAGLPPSAVGLEVTETMAMADPVRATQVMNRLRETGVRLALDDFGTGHASLAYLKHLPVQELKIDREFVRSMATDGRDAAIVRSTVDLARGFGLEVVAEGVEDAETLTRLEALGCQFAQGYHLSRPVPAAELEAWIARTQLPDRYSPSGSSSVETAMSAIPTATTALLR